MTSRSLHRRDRYAACALAALFVASTGTAAPSVSTTPSQGRTLRWDELVSEAERSNPELRAAEESERAALESVRQAWSPFLPQVQGSLSYTYNGEQGSAFAGGASPGLPAGGGTSNDFYTFALTATQNLFNAWRDRAALTQASAQLAITRAQLQATRARLSVDLVTAYGNAHFAQNATGLARTILRRRTDNQRTVELRFDVGRENRGSVELASAYVEEAKLQVIQADNAARVAQARLARVLGWDPMPIESGEAPGIAVAGPPPLVDPPSLTPVSTDVLERVPDVIIARANARAAQASFETARAGFLPRLDLTGQVTRQSPSFFPGDQRWAVSLNLSLPLFNGGRDVFGVRSTQATRLARADQIEDQLRATRLAIERARTDFVETEQRLRTDRSFAKAAETRALIAREKYNNGLLTFDAWDIIEGDLVLRSRAALASERDRWIAQFVYEQSLGRSVISRSRLEKATP